MHTLRPVAVAENGEGIQILKYVNGQKYEVRTRQAWAAVIPLGCWGCVGSLGAQPRPPIPVSSSWLAFQSLAMSLFHFSSLRAAPHRLLP